MTTSVDFLVRKDKLSEYKFVQQPLDETLAEGEILLKVDHFAFTANNITYAVFGDAMSYWNFFPTKEENQEWGRIPVWGYADIAASRVPDLAAGERIYGYLPMSSHLVVQPENVSKRGFVDAAPHRAGLPPVYNQYTRTSEAANHRAGAEPWQMLFRPLFMTSFLIEDFLRDNDFFGASQVILSSASSKTSFGLAFCLKLNSSGKQQIIGLTSSGNRSFVEGLGCYDQVRDYKDVEILPDVPSVYVDMAGNGELTTRLHRHLDTNMKYSCVVGDTHWETRSIETDIPGAKPEFFFAPSQIDKRNQDWGPGGVEKHLDANWSAFLEKISGWIQVKEERGQEAVKKIYLATLEGRCRADEGHIIGL